MYSLEDNCSFFAHLFSYANIPEEKRKSYEKSGRKIGKSGWTVAANIPLSIPLIIGEENWDESKIDLYFETFYIENNYQETTSLITHIEEMISDEYSKAFSEFKGCFNTGLLIPSILTLLSLLEGCLQDKNNKSEDAMNNLIRKRREDASGKDEREIPPTIFCKIVAINKFVTEYYKTTPFENENLKINRNTLVHGRQLNGVTKLECVRLLSCISSILSVDFFLK